MYKIVIGFVIASIIGLVLSKVSSILAIITFSGILGLVFYYEFDRYRPYPWNLIGGLIYPIGVSIIMLTRSDIILIVIIVLMALFLALAPSEE
ncbi:hypothetical protein [Alkalihalobacillus sp. CinArs1]|uniref:hypothetical protein n=1 Tax=Alkalihalobacillus sp. CinArs1 TaxID=2995314 RepID=UPI0022DE06CF|nr:hypothetical protein [Alkalihalobacillus sp. CinArs1]